MRYDTVVVRWSGGEEIVGTPALENGREAFLEDSSLTSAPQAVEYGTQWLAMHAGTVDQLDIGIEPGTALRPWSALTKGDAITVDDRDGTPQNARVLGVGFTGLRRNGVPQWSYTVGSAAEHRQITAQRMLNQLAEGSMRGTFGGASPRIAPSFGDLPTSALPRNRIPVADVDQFSTEAPYDRTKPYPFDDAQSIIRFECACESLVGVLVSEVEIWRVAFAADGSEIFAEAIDSFQWPATVYRFTYVTELLFLKGQGLQLRTPNDGAGAHRLITIQPIASSPN